MNPKQLLLLIPLASSFSVSSQSFIGGDDFESSSRNTNCWGAPVNYGPCSLVQANGRIFHTLTGSPSTASDDIATWPWKATAPANQDWTAQMDVNVPITFTPLGTYNGYGQGFGFGLAAYETGTANTYFSSGLVTLYSNATTTTHAFSSGYINASPETTTRATTTSTMATVRLRWVASTKVLYAEYDPNGPTGGFAWTQLRSIANPWSIGANNSFTLLAFGDSFGLSVKQGHQLYGDNFVASLGTNLTVTAKARPAVQVLWPSVAGRYNQVQTSTNLTSWQNLGSPVIGNGQTNNVFDPAVLPRASYRVLVQ